MYSRSAKGGEKGDPNRNPWLAKMRIPIHMVLPEKEIENAPSYLPSLVVPYGPRVKLPSAECISSFR